MSVNVRSVQASALNFSLYSFTQTRNNTFYLRGVSEFVDASEHAPSSSSAGAKVIKFKDKPNIKGKMIFGNLAFVNFFPSESVSVILVNFAGAVIADASKSTFTGFLAAHL